MKNLCKLTGGYSCNHHQQNTMMKGRISAIEYTIEEIDPLIKNVKPKKFLTQTSRNSGTLYKSKSKNNQNRGRRKFPVQKHRQNLTKC